MALVRLGLAKVFPGMIIVALDIAAAAVGAEVGRHWMRVTVGRAGMKSCCSGSCSK